MLLDVGTSSMLEQLISTGTAGLRPDRTLLPRLAVVGGTTPQAALGTAEAFLVSENGHIGGSGTLHMSPVIAAQIGNTLEGHDEAVHGGKGAR